MEIYERIKNRRKEMHLTATEVADALGISRATVYRYESKDIEKMPITIIEPLANILRCSVAYIMGLEETYNNFKISEPEKVLVNKYRLLNQDGREKLSERADELFNLGYVEKGESAKRA